MSDYHGWTHAPKADGGTDPIPGSTYTWARRKRVGSTQTIASGVQTKLTFTSANDVNDYPSDFQMVQISATDSGIEVQKDGLYAILCRVFCNSLQSEFSIQLWGIDPDSWGPYQMAQSDLSVSTELSGVCQVVVRLAAGQQIFATMWHDAGSNKTIDEGTFLEMVRLGAVTVNGRAGDS